MYTHQEVRDLLAEILKRPEFAGSEPLLIESNFLGQVLEFIFNIISEPWIIGLVVLITLSALAVLFLIFLRRHLALADRVKERKETEAESNNTHEALILSRNYAARHSYRDALRYLLLSCLLYLDDEGVLKYHFSKTNGEYLRQLQTERHPGAGIFKGLINLYEKICYGRIPCRKEDYEEGLNLYSSLREVRK